MCGIFIAPDREQFIELYNLNKDRGAFAFGMLYLDDSGHYVNRSEKFDEGSILPDGDLYLGHTRAPTCNFGRFNALESHPFFYEDWIVAHNGIIKNYGALCHQYHWEMETDSSIVPFLLTIMPMNEALEQLKGIFGLWMFNAKTKEVFVARCASTLYNKEGLISSQKIEGSELLEEGIIYKYKDKQLTKESTFKYDSPYFVL